ncbi:uncharacterized protein [Acropora muricata]|uniref:uncharacterized protein isoform X2 n=1 Tax=Acropora muricata TaxID=159855 RepID=UPI0034E46C0B
MHSLRRRFSHRRQRAENAVPGVESAETGQLDEGTLVSQTTALLPQTESRTVEEYSSGELHFIVDYVGSAQISEAKSITRMLETLKRIKKQQIRSIRVNFTIRDGILLVSSFESNSLVLTAPLYAIALCVQEQLRGFDTTFGLNITRRKTHMCHVFEAGSQLEAASIVRTVALAFKAIGKLTREKIERESRRARRTYSISSTERTRTNSEVSTTSTIGSSSAERRYAHVPGKHNIDSSSGQRSPHGKKFNKLSTNSNSILRHPTSSSSHTSGRHVEFSALSPVPSDGSDSDGKESMPKQSAVESGISVRADVHRIAPSWTQTELPVWVKRHHKEPARRSSLPIVNRKQEVKNPSALALENCSKSHSLSELILPPQSLSETGALDVPSPEASSPAKDQKENQENVIEDGEIKSNALLENALVSEGFELGRSGKNDVTDNFMMDTSFLPIESFHKEPVVSPDRVSSSFSKFKGLDSQELTQPLADDNGRLDNPEIVHKAITAVERGQTELVEKYLEAGLSVNAHDAARRSLLYYSVSLGDVEMSQFLLKRGADINWEGPDDKSPLHVAASAGNRAVTQLLLGFGADIRAKDNNYCTPLHMSAEHRSKLEVSFLLVEHGARIFENNIHGIRPVDLEPELKEMQRLLVQSACEAFAAADISKSRSNSGTSSVNQSSSGTSNVRSKSVHLPKVERIANLRRELFQHKRSSSLCSIPGGRCSPGMSRGKNVIRRSESTQFSRTLSPLLAANSKRSGLLYMHNFHKTIDGQNSDVDPRDSDLDQPQSLAKQTDSSQGAVPKESNPVADVPQSQTLSEPKDVPPRSCSKAELRQWEGEHQAVGSTADLVHGEIPLNPSNVTAMQSDDSNNISLPVAGIASNSTEDPNPLSPFTPKKHSLEEDQNMISDLINFSDSPRTKAAATDIAPIKTKAEATPPVEVQPVEETNHVILQDRKLSSLQQSSLESDQSAVNCQRSASECEESSVISTSSHYMRDDDPVIEALEPVVLLSGNPECHSSLLAYICLPRASGQLISLTHMPSVSTVINNHIAVLIGNLFNLEGADSRKRSVEAGLIETVLKLVDGPEPIQSTCLSILQSILDFNSEQEFSTALKTIPLEPLLNLLQSSDVDSGAFDLRQSESPPPCPPSNHDRTRLRKRSSCSQSSYDERAREMSPVVNTGKATVQRHNSTASDTRSDVWPLHSFGAQPMQKKNSVCSMGSSIEGEHSVPLYSPGFGLSHFPFMDLHSKTVPKAVACKMLSASSIHPKMQIKLGKTRPLSLLLETLNDGNPEIVLYCVATLANIAITVDNHMQIELNGGVDGLKQMLSYGDARVRYHAARGLIYLGCFDVGGIYLFKRVPGDEKLDVLFGDSAEEEHLFVKFHDPWFGKYFDGDPSTGQMQDYSPLPVLHIYLMRLWTAWLDNYPEDFVNNPVMASELSEVILPLRQAGGPYLPCAEILEYLIHNVLERASKKGHLDRFQANHCHHAILYEQCQKAIVKGNLPCSVEDSIYLSALQLYIEDLSPAEARGKPSWSFLSSSKEKLSVSRIKPSLHQSMYKVKNVGKRIKVQYEQFVTNGMTERNAKHNFIDYCQTLPGYGCHFYKLKECMGAISPKGGTVKCYFGVSPKKITVMDEKTKAVIGTWQLKELKRWRALADDTRLRVEFINNTFEFILDNKGIFKEINDVLLTCAKIELQILAGEDFSPWSKYAEETETWGELALAAVAPKPVLYSDKYDSDSGMVSRLRALSLASSMPDRYARKVGRRLTKTTKLSTSAPHKHGGLQQKDEPGSSISKGQSADETVSGSPGDLSVASQTSADVLLGSLQSTLQSLKCSWEGGSLSASEQRRTSRGSGMTNDDESGSPSERAPLDPSGLYPVGQEIKHSVSSSSHRRKFTSESNPSSQGSDSPSSSGQLTPTRSFKGPFNSTLREDDDFENLSRSFGQSTNGQLLICQCPPDAELPGFNRRDFTPFDLLQYPKELARQITLIDHECFCAVTATDIQKKIAMGTGKKRKVPPEERLSVEKVADRFNQLSTWVAATIVTEKSVEKRANMFINFIETAKLCLELRNFNAVMAIVVAALGCAPVRRLHKTKELVPKEYLEQYAKMEILMDTKDNYKRYRQALATSPTPSVPYFGIYMKDLTFIAEGNPDFFKGGLINLTKRRQIYLVIDEIRRFQKDVYNFQEVSEIRDYLANEKIHTEKELYDISCQFEPGLPRRHSEAGKMMTSRPVPKSSAVSGRMAGKRSLSLSRSSTTFEAAATGAESTS